MALSYREVSPRIQIAYQPSEIYRLPGFFQMYGESFLRGVSLSAHSVRRNIPSIYCVVPEEL